LRREYDNLNRQHNFAKISISSTLSELQKIKNQMENKNTQVEYDLLQTEENSKDEVKNEKIIFNNLNLKKYT
jgi:hypothetical protein